MRSARLLFLLLLAFGSALLTQGKTPPNGSAISFADSGTYDRDYALTAFMVGYFGSDGARNPTLRANKGERVRITITNGETMTHDVSLEKMGIKSETILEKGRSASITFVAQQSDNYFCSIPGHRAAGMLGSFGVVEGALFDQIIAGQLPIKGGCPLNLDFETGTLQDWTATGDAFANALVSAEPSPLHEPEMKLGFAGKYFLSSGGTRNAALKGTLTSVPFKVTQPYAAFKVSGGALLDTRVELVRTDNQEVIFHISGNGKPTLLPVVVDLQPYQGKEIFIRLVDNEDGLSPIPYIKPDLWAHLNFDDFKFYPSRPDFANELRPEDIIVLPPLDPVLNAGLSGPGAAKAMTLPEGFKITLAAAEPDVVRPVAFTIDAKGRLWVVEAHTHPSAGRTGRRVAGGRTLFIVYSRGH